MQLPEKSIKKFQEIYKKEKGIEITYEEAADAGNRLVGLMDLLWKHHRREEGWKEKLREFPKGYHLMDGGSYNCGICHNGIRDEQLWYDKWGKKCLPCQDAVNKKIIPGSICYNDEVWYSIYDFESRFLMKAPTVRSLIKKGILKSRVVPDSGFQVLLIKDNKEMLPPKKLVGYVSVPIESESGRVGVRMDHWYEHADPREVLKNCKILQYLPESLLAAK